MTHTYQVKASQALNPIIPLTLHLEVLRHEPCDVDAALGGLRVVAVLQVERSHAVQPGLPQLRRVAVGLCQAVMEVYHFLWIILVNLWGRRRR